MSSAIFLNTDSRYHYLSKQLESKHIKTFHINDSQFDINTLSEYRPEYNSKYNFAEYDFVFGPIPLTKDQVTLNQSSITLTDLQNALQPHQHFFSCNIPIAFRQELDKKQIAYTDYNDDIAFQTKNSIATAEGAIAWAINNSVDNLFKSNVLILGYGCCGKQLAQQLSGFHTNLTITGRRPETKAQVYCDGFEYLDLTKPFTDISSYSYIFNTIPALILTKELLETGAPDCTIVDVASAPGGLDYDYVQKATINAHLYLGIPGKIAPKASADILYKIISPKIV